MPLDLLTLGGALVDISFPVDYSFLTKRNLKKGAALQSFSSSYLEILHENPSMKHSIHSGGSANNVAKIVGALGLQTAFLGNVGEDPLGLFFKERIETYHVNPLLHYKTFKKTGHTLIFVTPDGDRTMCPQFEAAKKIKAKEISTFLKKNKPPRLIFLDSYNLHYKGALEKTIFNNPKYQLALDLSDKGIVKYYRKYILELLYANRISILFANEEEICTLTQSEDPILAAYLIKDYCSTLVLMCGEQGSIAFSKNQLETFRSPKTQLIDRTGVGDVFIGGFLYGYLSNKSLKESLAYGTLTAVTCLGTLGVDLPIDSLRRIAS